MSVVNVNEHQTSSLRPVLATAHSVEFEAAGEVVTATVRDSAGNVRRVEVDETGNLREVE
jgi:hypothetical protein